MSPKKAANSFSPLTSGADPRTMTDNSNVWLKLDPNTSVDVVCLVEAGDIISCEQCAIWLEDGRSPVWVYTGPQDPSHELNVDRRYKAYLPVLEGAEVKVWPMGKQAHTQIMDIADAVGGKITGLILRLQRRGNGLQTRYVVTNTGRRKDVSSVDEVDVVALLGPLEPEGVKAMIAERLNVADFAEVMTTWKGKKITKAQSKPKVADVRGKHVKPEPEDEDDDDELVLDEDDVSLT